MPRRGPRIALLADAGTNCDQELARALASAGARPEVVPLAQFDAGRTTGAALRRLDDYAALFVPGGFSAGDYVRAGAILAARIRATIGPELEAFVASGRLVGGICNGFQVLTELGLLPGRPDGRLGPPEAALMTNDSGHYECRPTFVTLERSRWVGAEGLTPGERFLFPSGHGEGKLVLVGDPAERVERLARAGQVLCRWVAPDGGPARYPWNPNGSVGDVAGLCNPTGNVFGLMPHPERNLDRSLAPDWTRSGGGEGPGDGYRFFASLVRYAARGPEPRAAA